MTYNKLLILAVTGLLALFLTACASPSPIKEYVYVHDAIPPSLLEDCPGYDGPLMDNGDLARAFQAERQGRVACNADKEALREWDSKRGATPTNPQPKKE